MSNIIFFAIFCTNLCLLFEAVVSVNLTVLLIIISFVMVGANNNVHQCFKPTSKDLINQDDGCLADIQPFLTLHRGLDSYLQGKMCYMVIVYKNVYFGEKKIQCQLEYMIINTNISTFHFLTVNYVR